MIIDSNILLMILRRLIALYLEREDRTSGFCKFGHALDTFYKLVKEFSFRQRLNTFARNNEHCKNLRSFHGSTKIPLEFANSFSSYQLIPWSRIYGHYDAIINAITLSWIFTHIPNVQKHFLCVCEIPCQIM